MKKPAISKKEDVMFVFADSAGNRGMLVEEQYVRGGPQSIVSRTCDELFEYAVTIRAYAVGDRFAARARHGYTYSGWIEEALSKGERVWSPTEHIQLAQYASWLRVNEEYEGLPKWEEETKKLFRGVADLLLDISYEPVLRTLFEPFVRHGSTPLHWGQAASTMVGRGEPPSHALRCVWGLYRVEWHPMSRGNWTCVLLDDPSWRTAKETIDSNPRPISARPSR